MHFSINAVTVNANTREEIVWLKWYELDAVKTDKLPSLNGLCASLLDEFPIR